MSIFGNWFGLGRDDVYELAMAAYDGGDYERAVLYLEQSIDDRADADTVRLARFHLADSHVQLSRRLLANGEFSSALAHLEIALGRFPNYPNVNLLAAKASFALGDGERTQVYLQRSLRANPRMGEALAFYGAVLFSEGFKAEGLAKAAEAFEVDPGWSSASFASALDAYENGMDAKALGILLIAGQDFASDANSFMALGNRLALERDYLAAEEVYRKALSVLPNNADGHFKLGKVLFDEGRVDEASEEFEIAVKLNPDYKNALQFLESVVSQPAYRLAV
jgi:tetratricopeptide (TPR) repeat protein